MNEIMTMGEMIVEIMRDGVDQPLDRAGVFKGPYPVSYTHLDVYKRQA